MNENFPKQTYEEGDKKSSYIEMTVRGYHALINAQERRLVLTDSSGKGHEIKVGDEVKIHVENPRSGRTPSGKEIFGKMGVNGILQSVGAKFAVVKYGEKNVTVPLKEFLEDQTFSIEEQERKAEKNR